MRGHPKGQRFPCRHCNMCDDYRLERTSQEQHKENGGFRDERLKLITFKEWLQKYEWN